MSMSERGFSVTAPFTIFFRTTTGEGGFACRWCLFHRHDNFGRMADAFAVATQHLSVCRAAVRHRPVEGEAVIDGAKHAVVLRDGIMVVAVDTVFRAAPMPLRLVI